MKRARRIAITLTAIVAVLLALPLMVYVPPVQRWLVDKATAMASEATGMDISIGAVSLRFPLTLSLGDVLVTRPVGADSSLLTPHSSLLLDCPRCDTIANIRRVDASVALLPLFSLRAELGGLTINEARLNTLDLISDTQVCGSVGCLDVGSANALLDSGTVDLTSLLLADADLCILLSDTAAVDTTESEPLPWRIALGEATLQNVSCEVHMPGDSMVVATKLGKLVATDADINLAEERYAIGSLLIGPADFSYDQPIEPRHPETIDYSHLAFSDVSIAIDSIVYCTSPLTPHPSPLTPPPFLSLALRHASLKEQCGLQIDNLTATVALDSLGIRIPSLSLNTPTSTLYAQASINYASFDAQQVVNGSSPGAQQIVNSKSVNSKLNIEASLSSHDLSLFHPLKGLPDWPLSIKAKGSGNRERADIEYLTIDLPTVIHAEANGPVALTPHSSLPTPHSQPLTLHLTLHNATPLLSAFGISQKDWHLPSGLRLDGTLESDNHQYIANLTARDGSSSLKAKALVNTHTDAYTAIINITTLDLGRFIPAAPVFIRQANLTARGRGFDPYNKRTFLEAEATIDSVAYEQWATDSLHLTAKTEEGQTVAKIGIGRLSAKGLNGGKASLDLGMAGDITVQTNLKDSHKLSGLMKDIVITDSLGPHFSENLGVLLAVRPDTTYARVQNGNFIVKLDATGPYDLLLSRLTALGDTLHHQFEARILDQATLKQMLPNMRLYITSGRENVVARFLKATQDIDCKEFVADITMSSAAGVNGQMHIDKLAFGSTVIDTVLVTLRDSDHGLTYQARVANGKKNPLALTALLDGHLYEHGAKLGLRIFDKDGRMGLRIGTQASMEHGGMRFALLPKNPTIGFRQFILNDSNYLFLHRDLRLEANVQMEGDNSTSIDIYSTEEVDSTRLQDLTVSISKLDLKRVTAIAPFMPNIEGLFDGDFHIIMDQKKQISVAADVEVGGMVYEGNGMGDINTEFVYLQNTDNTHAIDGILMRDGLQVASLSGSYINKKVSDGHEHLDGRLELVNTPLDLANGFIPDRILGFEGFANGALTMRGPLSRLIVDGNVSLDSASVFSTPYGVRMTIDNSPITVAQSKLTLNSFKLYPSSSISDTLSITGSVDFGTNGPAPLNFRIRARDMQLINSRQQPGSLLFGKGFVNIMAMVGGTTEKTNVRGRIDILGKTDLTYLLLDSPLSTDNQMDELVKFTDFNDSTQVAVVQRPMPGGMDVNLTVNIDQGAHIRCGLNADQSNYVDLFGGGNLRLRMSDTEQMQLTGRYTLTNGTMKYSLPVIPLKTFNIQDGSYVEFTGPMDNPTLNITATERTRATVAQEGTPARNVYFDCGVIVTKTLSDMGLQFTISAPEDMAVQSQLQSMTLEQRGKIAVTMLTTGMYLADGNTAGFSMNAALSSFLQSEINNIAGNALSTLDISMGVDNSTDASGNMHTDYSFQFAKRFWNNRLKVEIGGKVSSGNDAQQGQKQSFFDNVSMEYRLSPTSNQYLKLFYKQNVYDWLDGYTGEYGGGYIYKRKMDHWWDPFILWKTPKPNLPTRK